MVVDGRGPATPTRPRFAVFGDGGELWCTCHDVRGLFVPSDVSQQWRRLELQRCVLAEPMVSVVRGASARGRDRTLEIAELRIIDDAGEPTGGYLVGGGHLNSSRPSAAYPDLTDATVEALLLELPDPAAEPLWRMWASGGPTSLNRWNEPEPPADSTTWRWAWLHVARLHAPWDRRLPSDPQPGKTVILDGAHVTDLAGLWCALGEAVNGPGGYFGADFHSVRDCLGGGFALRVPATVVWRHFDVASGSIPAHELAELLDLLAACQVAADLYPQER